MITHKQDGYIQQKHAYKLAMVLVLWFIDSKATDEAHFENSSAL